MPLDILLVEDEPTLLLTLGDLLEDLGHSVRREARGDSALPLLSDGAFDLLITDVRLPGVGGHELAEAALACRPRTQVVVMTAFGDLDRAVQLVRAGASDYLRKPFSEERLLAAVSAIEQQLGRGREVADGVVAVSQEMTGLLKLAARVARADVPVVVTGETGVGKEVIARFLHDASDRSQGPFVALNCAAISAALIDSELFGHERGAFTGAAGRREGAFRAADGGSLFLDEVGELTPDAQSKLLRALETHAVKPVGADRTISLDVRIIAATNRDLRSMTATGRFREDLLFRLETFELHIPPLRERPEDILPLAERFAREYKPDCAAQGGLSLTPDTRAALLSYPWPGNVRELRNAIEHAAVLTCCGDIAPEYLPPRMRSKLPADSPMDLRANLRRAEAELVKRALVASGGSRTEAARLLGVSRKHVWEVLRRSKSER